MILAQFHTNGKSDEITIKIIIKQLHSAKSVPVITHRTDTA